MAQTITVTFIIPDGACCPSCGRKATVNIDELIISIGECECGCELVLDVPDGVKREGLQ